MRIEEAHETARLAGNLARPTRRTTSLQSIVAETVAQLPWNIQAWLQGEPAHVFLGGHGKHREFFRLDGSGHNLIREVVEDGERYVRCIFLSAHLLKLRREQAVWAVARQVAGSRLRHLGCADYDAELKANWLVESWGFQRPTSRVELS
jgi:hypothetical protein